MGKLIESVGGFILGLGLIYLIANYVDRETISIFTGVFNAPYFWFVETFNVPPLVAIIGVPVYVVTMIIVLLKLLLVPGLTAMEKGFAALVDKVARRFAGE